MTQNNPDFMSDFSDDALHRNAHPQKRRSAIAGQRLEQDVKPKSSTTNNRQTMPLAPITKRPKAAASLLRIRNLSRKKY